MAITFIELPPALIDYDNIVIPLGSNYAGKKIYMELLRDFVRKRCVVWG